LKPVLGRKKKIDLLVIRYVVDDKKKSRFKLANSKPCMHCVHMMNTLAGKKGYQVINVFYSNDKGGITKKKRWNLDIDHRSGANKCV
jgi:hypothetical protein